MGDESGVDDAALLLGRTAEVEVGPVLVVLVHDLFVDSLHGSILLALVVGSAVLAVHHLLRDVEGDAADDVPLAVGAVLDDVVGKPALQQEHLVERMHRFGVKALVQVVGEYRPELGYRRLGPHGHAVLVGFSQPPQMVFAPAQMLGHADGGADVAESEPGMTLPEDGIEVFLGGMNMINPPLF